MPAWYSGWFRSIGTLRWSVPTSAYMACRYRCVLFKPHGDAFHPEDSWTLPDEAGVVPEVVLSALEELDHEYVRTLLVIGYSERDSVVVQKLIAPLDESWRTIRVGPSARVPMISLSLRKTHYRSSQGSLLLNSPRQPGTRSLIAAAVALKLLCGVNGWVQVTSECARHFTKSIC